MNFLGCFPASDYEGEIQQKKYLVHYKGQEDPEYMINVVKLDPVEKLYHKIKKELNIKEEIVISCQTCLCGQDESISGLKDRLKFSDYEFFVHSTQKLLDCYLIEYPGLMNKIQTVESIAQPKKVVQTNGTNIESNQIQNQYQKVQKQYPPISSLNISGQEAQIKIRNSLEEQNKILNPFPVKSACEIMNNLITLKTKELTRLHNSQQAQSAIISQVREKISLCLFCQQGIFENQIYLSCNHQYHEECLQEFITAQLIGNPTQLICLCNTKITKNTLSTVLNRMFVENCQHQLVINQLMQIKAGQKRLKFVNCKNNHCYFFYINDGSNKISYCPVCLR